MERRSDEPTIMETIVSVLKALQEYEHVGGFASTAATDVGDAVLAAPAAHVEPTADAFMPPQVNEGREASPPQLVRTAETPAPVPEPGVADPVVGEEGTSPPRPVAGEAEGVEARVLDGPSTVVQEPAAPETMTRATTTRIQEAEETGRPFHKA
jgi:hypothetical protein